MNWHSNWHSTWHSTWESVSLAVAQPVGLATSLLALLAGSSGAAAPPGGEIVPTRTLECEVLVVGGGLAGTAAAYEALRAGREVCLTEVTDWIGGQLTSQGTSAIDETDAQRRDNLFPRGYREFRDRIRAFYGRQNPGNCWVSVSCFLPSDAQKILTAMLQDAARQGRGRLHWLPNTVIKDLQRRGSELTGAIAITRHPTRPNAEPLSAWLADAYSPADSPQARKEIVRLGPRPGQRWFVVEATETGELLALADVPYQVGVDPRNSFEPSSSSPEGDRYCTQGFTYTFAMQATAEAQVHPEPPFYRQYEPLYSYDKTYFNYENIFTYRRIWATHPTKGLPPLRGTVRHPVDPGDISMQNWQTGNDYSPGTAADNHLLTREQLRASGQLAPGGWQGGLRLESLRRGEEAALGYFHWLVAGTSDALLGPGVKQPVPTNRLLVGLDSPMGTEHGLSKYPYIREARRLIGRPGWGYPEGFGITELDFSRRTFADGRFRDRLTPEQYRLMRSGLAGVELLKVLMGEIDYRDAPLRMRAVLYPDTVGIAHYAIDFHPCKLDSPPEKPGNRERSDERLAHGSSYPFQIPLRASIPQGLDNLLVVGKAIATSHIAAAAYRVHPFEWASGAAIGTAIDQALATGEAPHQWVDDLPRPEPALEILQRRLDREGNRVSFPGTSLYNESWGPRQNTF